MTGRDRAHLSFVAISAFGGKEGKGLATMEADARRGKRGGVPRGLYVG